MEAAVLAGNLNLRTLCRKSACQVTGRNRELPEGTGPMTCWKRPAS